MDIGYQPGMFPILFSEYSISLFSIICKKPSNWRWC